MDKIIRSKIAGGIGFNSVDPVKPMRSDQLSGAIDRAAVKAEVAVVASPFVDFDAVYRVGSAAVRHIDGGDASSRISNPFPEGIVIGIGRSKPPFVVPWVDLVPAMKSMPIGSQA